MKSLFYIICLTLAMSSSAAPSDAPAVDINYQKDLKLWRAQREILTAFDNIQLAERESSQGLGGHARKAEELLIQAAKELKAASARQGRN